MQPQNEQQSIFAAANKFDFQRIYNKRQVITYTLPQIRSSSSSQQYRESDGVTNSLVVSSSTIPTTGTILIAPYDRDWETYR